MTREEGEGRGGTDSPPFCAECFEFVREATLGFDKLSDEQKLEEVRDHARFECTHGCEECFSLRVVRRERSS